MASDIVEIDWQLVPPPGTPTVDSGAARWWREGEFLCNQSYRRVVTGEHLRAGLQVAKELGGDRPRVLLAEAGPMIEAQREARELLASREAAELFAAVGVVIRSPVAKVIMSFFARIAAPPFPVHVFTSAREARDWAAPWPARPTG